MANPIVQGLENGLGLDTTAGTQQLQQAMQALQAVGVPTAQQLDLPTLQKYVSAGILTPQQYQAIQANPQVYSQMIQQTQDNSGMTAQKQALQQLGGIAQTGSTPIMQAQLINAINTANQSAQANRAGVQENAQERGVAGGGQELLGQLLGDQGAATTANQGALQAGANNAQLALSALSQEGSLGGQLQGQAQQSAQAQAQAAQQIAQYNSQLQSAANQYNTQNANQAQQMNLANAQNISGANTGLANQQTEYNVQVPQTIYGDQMQKAQAEAQQYGNQAQLAEQQAQNQNAFTGNLIGAGATLGGDYLMGSALSGSAGNAAQNATSGMSSGNYTPPQPAGYSQNNVANNPNWEGQNYAQGGEIVDSADKEFHSEMREEGPKMGISHQGYAMGGMCYAKGGEAHSHEICMKMGGKVPGKANVPGDSTKNDTIPARLSPHEIVLPRSVSQAPNAPQQAAKFVGAIKGQSPQGSQMIPQGNGKSFADVIKELEANGLELRLGSK
jgi:hypothetical protein